MSVPVSNPNPDPTSNPVVVVIDPKPTYRTCKDVCGQTRHCGNRYCSLHPKHYQVKGKR